MIDTLQGLLRSLVLPGFTSIVCVNALAAGQDGIPAAPRATDALFVVEMTYKFDKLGKDPKTARVQPGFLIDPEFGVTALSGLVRAETYQLYVSTSRTAIRFDVVGADPALDLAVIHISSARKGTPIPAGTSSTTLEAEPSPVCLAEHSPSEQPFDEAHAVLWIDLLGKRDVRRIELSELLDPAAEGEPHVLPTSLAGGLSGLPIVDAEDRLVGIWQWTWAEEESVPPQLVPASVIESLVERAKTATDPKTLDRLAAAARSSSFAPVLAWSGKEAKPPHHGVARAGELRSQLRCSRCGGVGTKPGDVEDHRGRVTRKDVPCTKCEQTRVVAEDERWERLRGFATQVTLVAPSSGLESVAREIEKGLGDALELNQSAILLSAYDGGKEELALANLVPGRAIVFTLHRDSWPTEDRTLWGEHVRLVDDPSYPPLILRAPYARSTVGEGQVAWVTAVVAGSLTVNGETAVVLDRAIVVPVAAPNDFRAGR